MKIWHGITTVTALALFVACDPPKPSVITSEAEALATFEISAPAEVLSEQPFEISIVAVSAKGTKPLTSYNGTVTLSSTVAKFKPDTLVLKSGTVTATVSLAGTIGTVDASVTGANIQGQKKLQLKDRISLIAGAANDPVASKIVDLSYIARDEDFSTDDLQLKGLPLSFNTLLLVFKLETTVGEANEILSGVDASIVGGYAGVDGQASGILAIRLPSKTHLELIPLLEKLRANPKVETVSQDVKLGPTIISKRSQDAAWVWDTNATRDGNWGLEFIRVPQMWNFNDQIRKSGVKSEVTVLDVGFAQSHVDLVPASRISPLPNVRDDHGTHVAGTIAATFNNGIGIDGINPFSKLNELQATSFGQGIVTDFNKISDSVAVVNISLGYGFSEWKPPIDSNTSSGAQQLANSDGQIFKQYETTRVARGGKLPVVVAAAGNDSNKIPGAGNTDAKFSSPYTNAALVQGVANVIVVEALDYLPPPNGGANVATIAVFSNINGTISAPGVGILSSVLSNLYASSNGTSMAAPHVTGVIGYLYALNPLFPKPTLTNNPMRDLLLRTAVPVGPGVSPRIDAFQAAASMSNGAFLRKLVDFDDGTEDGNTRITAPTAENPNGTPEVSDTRGDGTIDMSDFRRWRDAYLFVAPTFIHLDGPLDHPKKDLNEDGLASQGNEFVYPRADFNGDGQLSLTATSNVAGRQLTDLQVLQQFFTDPDYSKDELPNLVGSYDRHFDLTKCINHPSVSKLTLQSRANSIIREYNFTKQSTNPIKQLTLPQTTFDNLLDKYLLLFSDSQGAIFYSRSAIEGRRDAGDDLYRDVCDGAFLSERADLFDQISPNGNLNQASDLPLPQGSYQVNFHNADDIDFYKFPLPTTLTLPAPYGGVGRFFFRILSRDVVMKLEVFNNLDQIVASTSCGPGLTTECKIEILPKFGATRVRAARDGVNTTTLGRYTFQTAWEFEPQQTLPNWLGKDLPRTLIHLPRGVPQDYYLTELKNFHVITIDKGDNFAMLQGVGLNTSLLDETGQVISKGIGQPTDGGEPMIKVLFPSSFSSNKPYVLVVERLNQPETGEIPDPLKYRLGIQ